MSEDKSRKTEPPTPRRLHDAREKGQVVRSKELVAVAVLIVTILYFWLSWEQQWERLQELILLPAGLYRLAFEEALRRLFERVLQEALWLALPLVGLVVSAGILGNVLQFGVLFSAEPIQPKLEKISPIKDFKRIFATRQLLGTLLAVIKAAGIAALLYGVIAASLGDLIHDPSRCDVVCLKALLETLVRRLIVSLVPLLVVLAAVDYWLERSHFFKEQRMTKEELKREGKDREGDPSIKSSRRQQQREMVMDDLGQRIRNARVLITDVDAVAIALYYEPGVTPLPLVLAIGKGGLARRIIELAGAEQVPMVDDPALANLLLEEGVIDHLIPSSAVEQTANVFQRVPAQAAR